MLGTSESRDGVRFLFVVDVRKLHLFCLISWDHGGWLCGRCERDVRVAVLAMLDSELMCNFPSKCIRPKDPPLISLH